jgi:tetratricopeptide (TPR) repeat protein
MKWFGQLFVLMAMVALAGHYWKRLAEADKTGHRWRWLLNWIAKGMLLPLAIWTLLNLGVTPFMPAVSPITAIRSPFGSLGWRLGYLAMQTGPALVVIGSYWAALTLGWFFVKALRRAEEPKDSLVASGIACIFLCPFVWLALYGEGLGGIGFALLIWFWPVTHLAIGSKPKTDPTPSYTRATAKMKFGKYGEAELAILGELEKCENDFDGWMMLADLYAHHFGDLEEAERTIQELCSEPQTTLSQASVALHRLAGWQLELRGDPAAARRALEQICERMPDTHLAKMARLRMNQLPATGAEMKEQHARLIPMPALNENLDEPADAGTPANTPEESLALANQCVEKLKQNPDDAPVREKLAEVFADSLGQLDLALEQIGLLMEMPGQTPGKMAEWLALMAAWEIKYRGDGAGARKFLERLINEFPQSPQAFAAQRRIGLMNVEQRFRKLRPAVN